jgi:hypothetical protein
VVNGTCNTKEKVTNGTCSTRAAVKNWPFSAVEYVVNGSCCT